MAEGIQAGVAEIDVTPPVGTNQGGFGSRDHGAVGIHDPLRAKALALSDGDTTVALVTCDILSLAYDFTDPLFERMTEVTGLPRDQVMLTCSHTHSGPITRGIAGFPETDDEYLGVLGEKLVSVAKMALDTQQAVTVGFARGEVQVGINRREMTPEGMKLGRNPEGPVAPYVDVMAVRDGEGGLLAAYFSHAAHPVVLGGDNYLISADYPGYAQRAIEAVHPGALALFAQGCCGDINAERGDGTFDQAQRLGKMLAGAVIATLEEAQPVEEPSLALGATSLDIPLEDPPPVEEAAARVEALREDYEAARAAADAIPERLARCRLERAERILKLAEEGVTGQTERFDLKAFRIGPTGVIGLPGEVFVEYALNLDAASPFEQNFVLAYSNGCISYVPTAEAYPHGGYEVSSAIDYYGTLMLSPASEQVILDGAGGLLRSLA